MRRRTAHLDPLEQAVHRSVVRYAMFADAASAVVAVSGGSDSMALLYALVRIRSVDPVVPELVVAHLDHQLRGAESQGDASFVAERASALGLPFEMTALDVAALAVAKRQNLEAVARDVRYAFLAEVARRHHAVVATGHTATDQAETVLMRLARGAGVDGIAGIAPVRLVENSGVSLVRPLLGVSRRDVVEYCRRREIPFRTDSTNADTDLTRVFVREKVLPLLERISPGAVSNLARTAALAADDRAYFARKVVDVLDGWGVGNTAPVELPARELEALEPALRRRIIREALRRARGDLKRIERQHVESIESLLGNGREGKRVTLPYGLFVVRTREKLTVDANVR